MKKVLWLAAASIMLAVGACGPQAQVEQEAPAPVQEAEAPAAGVTIEGGVLRPAAAGATTAAYFTLQSGAPDRLIAASSPVAERVELHAHVTGPDGLMGMRQVEGGIEVTPGQPVVLQPGGLHLMFFNVTEELSASQVARVVLTFEQAGAVEALLTVGDPGVPGAVPAEDHSAH